MSRTGRWMALISWGLPVIVACSFGQEPMARPGTNLMVPRGGTRSGVVGRPTVAPRAGKTPRSAVGPHSAFVMPAAPSGPLPQVPMAQIPSSPPVVTYQHGMLTIVAQNSSLGDILREVHRTTGAVIEVPSNANERVVTRIGPGPARDVLATLLNGTAFNYVMVGTASEPTTLATVMITTKSGGAPSETVASAYQPAPQYAPQQTPMAPGAGPGGPVVQQAANATDDEADAEDETDNGDAAEEDQPAQDQAQSGVVPGADGQQPNAGPKTPEQILEMLRQRPVTPGQQLIRPPGQTPPPDNTDNNE